MVWVRSNISLVCACVQAWAGAADWGGCASAAVPAARGSSMKSGNLTMG
jgi:hypothetical protein